METLVFNARFATYAIAIAVLGGVAYFGKRQASEKELPLLWLAVVALNLLALFALTWEASDYFDRQLALPGNYAAHFHQVTLVQGFTDSAIWMIYGAILMTVVFRTRTAYVLCQALFLRPSPPAPCGSIVGSSPRGCLLPGSREPQRRLALPIIRRL